MMKGIGGLGILAIIIIVGGLLSAGYYGMQTIIRPGSHLGVNIQEFELNGGTYTKTISDTRTIRHTSGLPISYLRVKLEPGYRIYDYDDGVWNNLCVSGYRITEFCGIESIKCYKDSINYQILSPGYDLLDQEPFGVTDESFLYLIYEDIDCEFVEIAYRVTANDYKKLKIITETLPKTYTARLEERDLGVPQTVNCPSGYEFCHFETKDCDILWDKIADQKFTCAYGKCVESFGAVDETYECYKPTQNRDPSMIIYGDSYVVICDNDGICDSGENCENCPDDCPISSEAICCNGVETYTECDVDWECGAGGECSTGVCQNPGTCESKCVYTGLPDNTAVGGGKICCGGKEVNPTCINDYNCNDNSVCTNDVCNSPGTCSASCSNPMKEGYYIDPSSGVCHSPCSDGTGVNECSPYQTGFVCQP